MNGIFLWVPWALAALGALGFGYVGSRSAGSRAGWAIAGGLWCLVVSTMLLGLANAATVPYSQQNHERFQWVATAASGGLIVVGLVLAWFVSPYQARTKD